MSQANQNDPVWTLTQCAEFLRVKEARAKRLLISAQIRPVHTLSGVSYRAAEVHELRAQINAGWKD
jgi:hypothetical protein